MKLQLGRDALPEKRRMRQNQRPDRAILKFPRHAGVVERRALAPACIGLAARLAKLDRLGQIDRAEVGLGRSDGVGVGLNFHGLPAEHPAQGVVGVRADVRDAAGGGE